MTATFGLAVILYSAGVGAVCVVTAVRGRPRGPLVVPALIVIEVCVLAQAALDAAGLAGGPRPAELVTHLGYLVTSVAVLPVAAGSVRLDQGRWGSAALAVGCALVAIVSLRLHQTRHG